MNEQQAIEFAQNTIKEVFEKMITQGISDLESIFKAVKFLASTLNMPESLVMDYALSVTAK
jgi:hypothetical protein